MSRGSEKCPSCHSENPYNYRFGCLKHADGWHIRNQERQVKAEIAQHSTPPAPPPIDEIGWLLARGGDGKPPEWITVEAGFLAWNADANKALRLARRADAEMLAEIVDDCERIEDHIWTAPPRQTIDERAEFENLLEAVKGALAVLIDIRLNASLEAAGKLHDAWHKFNTKWQARASLECNK